jgi:hypothetical protein
MKRTAIFSALACVVLITTNGLGDSPTCEWHLKDRSGLDVKTLSALFSQVPVEEMMVWLDRYCPENPKEPLVAAMRKFLVEWKQRR